MRVQDALGQYGPEVGLSDRLLFLYKFHEAHRYYAQRQWGDFGRVLVSLLASGIAPRDFWIVLLCDAVPILELPDQVVFDVAQTYELLRVLQELRQAEPDGQALAADGADSGVLSHAWPSGPRCTI